MDSSYFLNEVFFINLLTNFMSKHIAGKWSCHDLQNLYLQDSSEK